MKNALELFEKQWERAPAIFARYLSFAHIRH